MLDEIGRKREKQIKHLEETSFNLLRDHDPNDYYDCDNAMISEFNLRQASDMREAERDRLNEAAYGRGLIAGAGLTSQAAITTELKQVDTQLIPIGELMERYRGEFNAFCQTNPKHKVSDNKRTQYTSSVIKYLSDVTSPRDLKLYYANHTPAYPTANCRNGFVMPRKDLVVLCALRANHLVWF